MEDLECRCTSNLLVQNVNILLYVNILPASTVNYVSIKTASNLDFDRESITPVKYDNSNIIFMVLATMAKIFKGKPVHSAK